MALTKKQIQAYQRNSNKCPFCLETGVVIIIPEYEDEFRIAGDNEYLREINCPSCKKDWREYFKLHDIEELDADGCAIPNEED